MNNSLDPREANTEYYDLNEPEFSIAAKKWFVTIMYDTRYFLHKGSTIQFGTFIDVVPGEHMFEGLFDNRKQAMKAIRTYNRQWALAEQNIDIDAELTKEFQELYE